MSLESGSRDLEDLAKTAGVVADRLRAAGMTVQVLPAKAPDFHSQLKGAPVGSMVYATRSGTGKRKVLLIAHMDTVDTKGMAAKQPFRAEGDQAWGLGISDDKGGVALALHTAQLLDQLGFKDYAQLGLMEKQLRDFIKDKLIPDATIELSFYRSHPAFVSNGVSRTLAQHAQKVYQELGKQLGVRDRATGAAFAGLRPKGGALESFGLRRYGSHSNDDGYIFIESIAPRLYLSTRMVMDAGSGAISW